MVLIGFIKQKKACFYYVDIRIIRIVKELLIFNCLMLRRIRQFILTKVLNLMLLGVTIVKNFLMEN